MPEHKTRLMQMLANEQKRRDWTDRQCAEFLGELQQTFSTWKRGSLPRLPKPKLAAFLQISDDMLEELVDEARQSTGSTKLPRLAAVREYGRIADRKTGRYKFDTTRKTVPEGRYMVSIDTKVMEPALHVGTKAWLDPTVWPKVGDEVMVITHAGVGWIGVLAEFGQVVKLTRYNGEPVTADNVAAVHVIVLSERK